MTSDSIGAPGFFAGKADNPARREGRGGASMAAFAVWASNSRHNIVTTRRALGFTTDHHEQQFCVSVDFSTINKITKPHSWQHLKLSALRAIAEQSVIGLKDVQSHQV